MQEPSLLTEERYSRLFLALPVNADVRHLAAKARKANESFAALRWVPLAQLHITALFIGDFPKQQLEPLRQVLFQCVGQHKPFALKNGRPVVGPPGKEVEKRMLWSLFADSPELNALHQTLVTEVAHLSPYSLEAASELAPHVTLARLKKGFKMPQLDLKGLKKNAIELEVHDLWLVESHLSRKGAGYHWVESYSLGTPVTA
jgi:2'-5' RNA ligase